MSKFEEVMETSQLSYAVHAYLLARGPQKPLYISLELNIPLDNVQQALVTLEKIGVVKKLDETSDYWAASIPTPLINTFKPVFDHDVGKIKKITNLDDLNALLNAKIDEQAQQVASELKELENAVKEFTDRIQIKLNQQLQHAASKLQEELKKFDAETTEILSRWESELKVEPETIGKQIMDSMTKIKADIEGKLDESATTISQTQQLFNQIITTSKQSSQVHLGELQEDLSSLLSDVSNDLTALIHQSLERVSQQLTETVKEMIETEVKRLGQAETVLTESRLTIDQELHSAIQTQFRQYVTLLSTQLVSSFKELIEKTQARLKSITDQFLKAHEETITERIEGITLVFADFSKEIADIKGELFSETGTNEQLVASMASLEETLDAQFSSLLDQVKVFFESVWSELREVIKNQRSSTLEELENFKNVMVEQVKSIFLLNNEFWDSLSKDFQESINELARLSDMLEQQLNLFMSNQIRIITKTKEEQKRILSQISKANQERVTKLIVEFQKDLDDYQQRMETSISEHLTELKEKHELVMKQSTRGLNKMKQVIVDSLESHSSQVQSRLNERLQVFESNLSSLESQYQRFHADLEAKINQVSGKVQNTITLRSAAIHGEIQQLLRVQKESLLTEIERTIKENNEEINAYYANLTSTIEDAYQKIQKTFVQLKTVIESRHSEQIRQLQQTQKSQLLRINQLFEEIQEKTVNLLNDLQTRLLESADTLSASYNELYGKLSGQTKSLLETQRNWLKKIPQTIVQEIQNQTGRLSEQISAQQEEITRAIVSQKEQSMMLLDTIGSQALGTKELFDGIRENLSSLGVQVNSAITKTEDQIFNNISSTLTSLASLSERQIEVSRYLLEVEVNTRRNKALKSLTKSTESLETRNKSYEESLLSSIIETVDGVRKATSDWEERMLQTIAQSKENFVKSSEELQGRQKDQARLVMSQLQQTWEEYRMELSEKLDTLLSQSDNRLAEIIRRLEESSTALSERIQQLIQEQQQLMRNEVETMEKEGFKEDTLKIEERFASIITSHVQTFMTRINEDIERLHDMIQDVESTISSRLLAVENQFQETHQVTSHELSSRLNQIPELLIKSLEDILVSLFDPLEQKGTELTKFVEKFSQNANQVKEILSQELSSSLREIKQILAEANNSLNTFKNELSRMLNTKISIVQNSVEYDNFRQLMPFEFIISEELQSQNERLARYVTTLRSSFLGLLQKLQPHLQEINESIERTLQHLESELEKVLSITNNVEKKYQESLHQRIRANGNYFSKSDVIQVLTASMKFLSPKITFFLCTMPSFLTKDTLDAMITRDSRINIIIPSDSLDKISPETLSYIQLQPRVSLYLNDQMKSQNVEKKGIIVLYDDKLLHQWVADSQVFLEIADEDAVKSFLVILKEMIWQGSRRASISRIRGEKNR